MKLSIMLPGAAIGIALTALPTFAQGDEYRVLRPFVGETTREFEARKRGVAPRTEGGGGDTLRVPADASGHFFVEPMLDGERVRMLVDTGASLVAISHEDAKRMALSVSTGDFTRKVATANGVVEAAPVQISEIQLAGISVRNVEALVLPPGRLTTSLLGMTFLKRLSNFEISGGQLVLRQ